MARTTAAAQQGGEAERGNSASPSNSDVGEGITSTAPPLSLEAGNGSSIDKNNVGSTEIRTIKCPGGDVYEGEVKDGEPHGRCVFRFANGSLYDGEWRGGQKHNGTETFANGDVYRGEFKENYAHGKGTCRWADGTVYDGQWSKGRTHGKGAKTYASGRVYKGEYAVGKEHGQGIMTSEQGNVYDGQWARGEPDGTGTLTSADGVTLYDGEWMEGRPHGRGLLGGARESVWVDGVQQRGEAGTNATTCPNALTKNAGAALRAQGSRKQPGEDKRVYKHERTMRSERSQQRQLQKNLAPKTCEHCGVDEGRYKLRVCSGCNLALYCSDACQKAARRSHRRICNIVSGLPQEHSNRLILTYDRDEMVDLDAGLRYATKYMHGMKHLTIDLNKMESGDVIKFSTKRLSSLLKSKTGKLESVFWETDGWTTAAAALLSENDGGTVWNELHSLKQLRLQAVKFVEVQPLCDVIGQQKDTLTVLHLPYLDIDWPKAKCRRAIAQSVGSCKSLVKLDLLGCIMMDSDLKIMLGDLPSLRILRLSRGGHQNHEFTDNTCGLIARKCPGLQEMNLMNHDQLSVKGIRKIFEGCSHLRSLYTTTRKLSRKDVLSLLDIAPQLLYLCLASGRPPPPGGKVLSAGELDEIIEATSGRTVFQLRFDGGNVFAPGSVSNKTREKYEHQKDVLNNIWGVRRDPEVANEWADTFEGW